MGQQRLSIRVWPFRHGRERVPHNVTRVPNPRRHEAATSLRSLDSRLSSRVVGAALTGVVLLGAGAVAATRDTPREPAAVVAPIRLTAEVAPSPVAVPPVPAKKVPAKKPARKPAVRKAAPVRHAPVTRWLPTGTGMWIHEFAKTEHGNARAVVARARRVGLSTLYVQTGSSKKGWIGTPTLRALLPATKGTSIRVVAWDFPTLQNPVADAQRLASAARFHCGGCPRVAAVAPDVETASEGTRIGDRAVARYYTALRRALPADVAILATVPWPSEKRTGRYPYARTASLSDAMMPMAYWYNRSPAVVTATSMAYLGRFHKPVMPVGQGYDSRLDAPYLALDRHPGASVSAFLQTAKRRGAQSVSLWSWQTTGGQQWAALARGNGLFRARVVKPGSRTFSVRR